MDQRILKAAVLAGVFILLSGCSFTEMSDKKVSDMEFTIVEVSELPEEISVMIDEKKEDAFQMAYHEEKISYIILGYGRQESTGYSIQVNEVYRGEDGVWVDTDLIGPEKKEEIESIPTYPYIIIKTEKIEDIIRFKS